MRYAANQEVVFIGPDYRHHPAVIALGLVTPVPKQVYTIRTSRWSAMPPCVGWCYLVHQIRNPVADTPEFGMAEQSWIPHQWLRPVEKKSSAIEDLLKLQDPANHQELEGV